MTTKACRRQAGLSGPWEPPAHQPPSPLRGGPALHTQPSAKKNAKFSLRHARPPHRVGQGTTSTTNHSYQSTVYSPKSFLSISRAQPPANKKRFLNSLTLLQQRKILGASKAIWLWRNICNHQQLKERHTLLHVSQSRGFFFLLFTIRI